MQKLIIFGMKYFSVVKKSIYITLDHMCQTQYPGPRFDLQ